VRKIAVEIKTFSNVSQITDFYAALGQYFCYKVALTERHPDRILYLAVPKLVYDSFFTEALIQKVLQVYPVKLLVYNLENKEIQLWIDEHYRQSIRQFLEKYVDTWREKDVETQLIIDSDRDHYLLLRVGWEGEKRINYSVFHFDIKDGKIWVQENNTDIELDKDLEEMGISKKEIVVGFHYPKMREYSDYATA